MTAPSPPPTDRANPLWEGGWYRAAQRLPSPNFGPRPEGARVRLIVVHSISLPPGRYGGPEINQLFTNCLDCSANPTFHDLRGLKVSSHWVIRRDGALWQYVSADDRAWHAGVSHYLGCANCNDFSVGIELEGLEGQRFTAAQYTRLIGLCQDIRARLPIEAIAGHEHIAPGRKHDPGAGFDWPALAKGLGWPKTMFPTGLIQA